VDRAPSRPSGRSAPRRRRPGHPGGPSHRQVRQLVQPGALRRAHQSDAGIPDRGSSSSATSPAMPPGGSGWSHYASTPPQKCWACE
jgi:hypothetical protein